MSDGIRSAGKWEMVSPDATYYQNMLKDRFGAPAPNPADPALPEPPRMTRGSCLDAARACVLGSREEAYGKPEDVFAVIAEFWSTYLGVKIAKHDAAAMMALFKIARIKANPSWGDSWVDGAGYLACGAEVANARA